MRFLVPDIFLSEVTSYSRRCDRVISPAAEFGDDRDLTSPHILFTICNLGFIKLLEATVNRSRK